MQWPSWRCNGCFCRCNGCFFASWAFPVHVSIVSVARTAHDPFRETPCSRHESAMKGPFRSEAEASIGDLSRGAAASEKRDGASVCRRSAQGGEVIIGRLSGMRVPVGRFCWPVPLVSSVRSVLGGRFRSACSGRPVQTFRKIFFL